MFTTRPLVLGLFAASLGLQTRTAAAEDTPDAQTEFHPGVRLGLSTALTPQGDVLPLVSAHADLRVTRDRYFIALSPGLTLPGAEARLSYGGLSFDLGGGWMISETALAPYVGAGVSARLQISDQSVVGFAPYVNLGLQTELAPRAHLFAEIRAYQNVLPVDSGRQQVFPTEVGMAFGVLF